MSDAIKVKVGDPVTFHYGGVDVTGKVDDLYHNATLARDDAAVIDDTGRTWHVAAARLRLRRPFEDKA